DVNVGSPSTTQSIVYDTTSLRIGQSQNANYFSGTIDEVRVWSRALSPDETVVMKRII
ncbi:MAG: LamG-like jellyroll fold domain-containing protein, partial [Candidatus Aenigmatarchaeota archaeon]